MVERKLLFICEGDIDEPNFINRLMEKCFSSCKYKIYSYRTTIHTLASVLKNNYSDFADGDTELKLILRELEPNPNKKAMLSEQFTDTILAFDFEPHHDHPDFDMVRKMLAYYTDSTDMGKLYINYPMMQSYKHFRSLPDPTFLSREASPIGYKDLVGRESCFTDLAKYDYRTFISIAVHNLYKAWKILKYGKQRQTPEEFEHIDWIAIFDNEMEKFRISQKVDVLNTLSFFVIDYNPSTFFREISKHPEKYDFITEIQ